MPLEVGQSKLWGIEAAGTFSATILDSLRRRGVVVRVVRSTLRVVVGRHDLDDLLHGDDLGLAVLAMVNDTSVTSVQIVSVIVPEWMEEPLALEAIAERRRRALLITVEAEHLVSARRAETAAILSQEPGTLFLVYLETLKRSAACPSRCRSSRRASRRP